MDHRLPKNDNDLLMGHVTCIGKNSWPLLRYVVSRLKIISNWLKFKVFFCKNLAEITENGL